MPFENLNKCFSSTQQVATVSAEPLSAYSCTEVHMFNHGSADCFIFTPDNLESLKNFSTSTTLSGITTMLKGGLYFKVKAGAAEDFRGLTNSNQVSALMASGTTGQLSFRAQFFSSNPLNAY